MASSRPRRPGSRRALLVLSVAFGVALAAITLGPVVSLPPIGAITVAPIAVTPTASPAARPTAAATAGDAPGSPRPSQASTGVSDVGSGPASPLPLPVPARSPAASPIAPEVAGAPRLTVDMRRALQARLDRLRDRYAIPGVSVAILFPGGTRWVGVSGLADVDAERAVTPATGFAVASISKTYTAALILALVEEGKIGLDAPARTYLPGLTKISTKVTIRQLLDHTSGLRDYFFHPSIDKLLLEAPRRRWDVKRTLRYVGKPYFAPGTDWHYSNTNYFVLGLVAEAVGRAPLAEQLRTRFFAPMRFRHTWYQPGEEPPGDAAHGYRFTSPARAARPIDLDDGTPIVPFTSVVTAAGGAGGVAASATDVARWARALYGGDVLGPVAMAAMLDPSRSERYRASVPYGLGVQAVEIDGRRTWGHSGRLLGFRAVVRHLPDEGVTIAVLSNQSRADPAIILRALLRVAFTPAASPTPAATPTSPIPLD
jgi:CubicO group peptidase (beta-lactamase class C family)